MAKHDQPNGTSHKRSGSKSSRKARDTRSASPTKFIPPQVHEARIKASPKKRGRKRAEKKTSEGTKSSSRALQDTVHEGTPSIADSAAETEDIEPEINEAAEAIADAAAAAVVDTALEAADELDGVADGEPQSRVTVTSDEQVDGEIDATRTRVSVEMPAGVTGQDFPADPEQAIKDAKAIVEEAKALQSGEGASSSKKSSSKKRKAEEMEVENSEEELITELVDDGEKPAINGEGASADGEKHVQFGERTTEPPTKRTRVMVPADEFRKQKMQKRALMGLTATVAVGAIIPFVSNLF